MRLFPRPGRLRERLDALGAAPRAELLHVLRLDFDRPTGSASSGDTRRRGSTASF